MGLQCGRRTAPEYATSASARAVLAELLSGEQSHWGIPCRFHLSCEAQFGELDHSCDLIATQSGLLEPTRAAAKQIAGAKLTERLDVTRAVFEEGAPVIAAEVLRLTD